MYCHKADSCYHILMNQILNFKYNRMMGLASFLMFSFSLLIGHEEESSNHLLILVKSGMIGLSAIMFLLAERTDSGETSKERYSVLAFLIILYELLLVQAAGRTIILIRDYPAIFNSIVWIPASIIALLRFRESFVSFWKRTLHDHDSLKLIISASILAIIVALLSAEPNGVMFSWDSDTLYQFIYELNFESLYDSKLLTFHSHVSAVYAHILVLLKLVFGNIRTSYFILNTLCILCASFGMTFLLRALMPNKRIIDYTLGNALFMLSPWVCGMSTYHMYDYYIWCLFPLMIYFMVKNNLIGFMFIGIMITFSKASGLIVFGSVCAGILIMDLISKLRSDGSLVHAVKDILTNIKYCCFLSVAIIFFALFKLGIAEETQFEDTVIGFDSRHILHQLKMYSSANFLWIFVILTILCIVFCYFKKSPVFSETACHTLSIILISDVIFIAFNCICITYRLPRYMNSHIAIVYIAAAVFLLGINKGMVTVLISIPVCILEFIGSFYCIDPISKCLFTQFNVGDRTIVNYEMYDKPSLGDSIVSSREYYSYEVVLDKALTYVIRDRSEDDDIMFSLGNQGITWGMSCGRYSYAYNEGKQYFDLFYDKTTNGLANGYAYEYYDSEDMIPFEMRYIFSEETVEDAVSSSSSDTFYYIYMPTMNENRETEIRSNYMILHEESFNFRGWKMNCIKFTI